jgi:hypothetical protein
MKLNVKAFALTCGILLGIVYFIATWWIIAFEGATGEPTLFGCLYLGFTISPVGSFIGLAWGVFDGLFCGTIFAWLYNLLSTRFLTISS